MSPYLDIMGKGQGRLLKNAVCTLYSTGKTFGKIALRLNI